MFTTLVHLGNPEVWSYRKFGLAVLLAVLSLAIAFGTLIPRRAPPMPKAANPGCTSSVRRM